MRYQNTPITHHEALRAIYLDFEGPGEGADGHSPPPVFAGIMVDGEYSYFVTDPDLKDYEASEAAQFLPLNDFLHAVKHRADSENRRIAYWSSHEREMFRTSGNPIEEIGFDVKKPAKRLYLNTFKEFKKASGLFRSRATPKTTKKALRTQAFGLLTILAAELGLGRPQGYGPGLVGGWISKIKKQASSKPSYAKWAKSAKAAATKTRKHNQHDCAATQHVLLEMLKTGEPLK